MRKDNNKSGIIVFFGYLSIAIGLAFLWGFGIKVGRWFSRSSEVEAFLMMVCLLSSLYFVGGIGILRKKRWSATLVRLLSLVWLMGILEALVFTFLIPHNLWGESRYFFVRPIKIIAHLHAVGTGGLELLPISMFLPFILFPCLYLWFFSLKNIKDRFDIEMPRKQNLRLWTIAILLPFLLYFISLSNFGSVPYKQLYKKRVCSPMTWGEFKIYKYIKELEEARYRYRKIKEEVVKHFGIEKGQFHPIWAKGSWLYRQWEKEGKTEEEFLALGREDFEKIVLKYGTPKYIGGIQCY